jgi:peptide/nickel transport system substrate-binding protein/oligopeptide transport system substrate-binding protein
LNNLNTRSRVILIVAVLVVAFTLVLAGCGSNNQGSSGTTTGGGTPKAGGTYNFPLDGEPVGIAPITNQESIGWNVAHQMFEGLFTYQLDNGIMKTVPNLCESFTVSSDAKTYTFKIKHGVMFQAPVNREVKAQDFVASWNAATDPKNWVSGTPAYIMEPIVGTDSSGGAKNGLTGVKALDDYTLQVTLKYPFADFPVSLGHPILSVWPVDYAMKEGLSKFNAAPVGTGPFVFKKWVHNQYIDLVKNPNWWNKTGGPYVDSVHLPMFSDPSTEWLSFQKGTIDWSAVPVGQVASSETLAKSKGWTYNMWPTLAVYYICFNWKDPVVGGTANLPLRQALSYSTDRDAVINTVQEGVDLQPTGVVPHGIPGSEKSTLAYPYDPDKAKEIVAKLGTAPSLKLWYNTGADHDKILAPVQAGWKSVGLNATMTGLEWGTYLTKIQKNQGDQIYRLGWIADYPAMDNFLYPLFTTGVSGVNLGTYYSNPQVDALVKQARGTTDDTQRENTYLEAEKIILADAPIIPLYDYRDYRLANPRVANQIWSPLGTVDMWKVWVAQ